MLIVIGSLLTQESGALNKASSLQRNVRKFSITSTAS
jgi:hypothetical protein